MSMTRRRFFASPLGLIPAGAASAAAIGAGSRDVIVSRRAEHAQIRGVKHEFVVNVDVSDVQKFVEEEVIPRIQEAIERRDVVIAPPNSRQLA